MNSALSPHHRRSIAVLAALLLVVPAAACRDDDPRFAAAVPEVRDSAGVALVWSDGPSWQEGDSWSIESEPSRVLGGFDDGSATLYRVSDLAVLPDGTMTVVNGGAQELLVFDLEGDVPTRIGRAGDGPGEFRWLNGVLARADSIVAVDGSRLRFSVFSPDGTLVREFTAATGPGELSGMRAASLGSGGIGVFRESALLDKGASGVVRLPADVFLLGWDGSTRIDLASEFAGATIFTGMAGLWLLKYLFT